MATRSSICGLACEATVPGTSIYGVRNVFDEEYFLLLSNQSGNSGLVTGIPADPRTYGITLRASF